MNIVLTDDKKSQEIQDKLNTSLDKLVLVFKSEDNVSKKKRRLPNKEVYDVIDEVLKEEIEETRVNFKEKAKNLIKSKVEFDKFIEDKKKEFQNAINQKSEEFIKESEELFKMIESMDELKDSYAKLIKPAKK